LAYSAQWSLFESVIPLNVQLEKLPHWVEPEHALGEHKHLLLDELEELADEELEELTDDELDVLRKVLELELLELELLDAELLDDLLDELELFDDWELFELDDDELELMEDFELRLELDDVMTAVLELDELDDVITAVLELLDELLPDDTDDRLELDELRLDEELVLENGFWVQSHPGVPYKSVVSSMIRGNVVTSPKFDGSVELAGSTPYASKDIPFPTPSRSHDITLMGSLNAMEV